MLKRAEPKDKKEPRFLSHFVEGYLLARNNHIQHLCEQKTDFRFIKTLHLYGMFVTAPGIALTNM